MNTASEIKNGNQEAFEQVYNAYHQKIFFFFYNKTRSAEISTELVQETFIKLWRFRTGLNTELDLSIQLFRMAKTIFLDILRKKAREREIFVPMFGEAKEEVAENTTDEYKHVYLDSIKLQIAGLPAAQRKIVEHKLDGFSNQEIADQLSISKKTVENQINKAYKEIKSKIGLY